MAITAGLAFHLLDAHVAAGRADEPALVTHDVVLSFAELLDASASLAGGLRSLGLTAGEALHLDVPDPRLRVVTVLACLRLGVDVVADPQAARVAAVGDRVQAGEIDEPWDLVMRAGRGDPEPAPSADPPGYADRALAAHGDVIEPLRAGSPVRA